MSHLFYPAFFSYQADVAEGLGIQFKSMVILDNNLCNNIHYSDTINPTFFKILKKKRYERKTSWSQLHNNFQLGLTHKSSQQNKCITSDKNCLAELPPEAAQMTNGKSPCSCLLQKLMAEKSFCSTWDINIEYWKGPSLFACILLCSFK